jgi:hypothetical protein
MMDVYEQAIYRQLYRLSYGNGQNWCTIGYGRLGKRANMKRNGVINVLERLEEAGWVLTLGQTTKGKTYRIYLPCENNIESETVIKSIPLKGIPPEGIPSDDTDGMPSESIPPNGTLEDEATPDKGQRQSIPLKGIPSDRPNIDLDHSIDPLSLDLVKTFYTGIGQKRISKTKREKGEKVIQELEADGFSLEDIQFAAEWTIKNAREKLYDFSILKDTIGQAQPYKEAAEQAREEEARVDAEEEERRRLEGEIQKMRAKLSEKDIAELREKALEEIRDTDEIKEQFITEPLITAKENEILLRQ